MSADIADPVESPARSPYPGRMLTKARREVAFYRELLKLIAKDLEHAGKVEANPERQRWFEGRARRVRERLVRGMPEDWTEPSTT